MRDVAPYERMKLRMLNGAHSLIAYAGFLAGHEYGRDVMQDAPLAALVDRHMQAAARTVVVHLPDIDLDLYRRDLLDRFRNPAIAHRTFQIAMDGTEKLPQRIFAPAIEALEAGDDIAPYAFASAAWMRYCTGRDDTGRSYEVRDPRAREIREIVETAVPQGAAALCAALMALPDLFPARLRQSAPFCDGCANGLQAMLSHGMEGAIPMQAPRR